MKKYTGSSRRGTSSGRKSSSSLTAKTLGERFRVDQRQSLDRIVASRSDGSSQPQLDEAQQPFAQPLDTRDSQPSQPGLKSTTRMRWPSFEAGHHDPAPDPEPEDPIPDPAPDDPDPIPENPDPEPTPEDPDPVPENPDPDPVPENPDPEPEPENPDPMPEDPDPEPTPEDPDPTPENPDPGDPVAPRVMGVTVGYLAARDEGTDGDWFVAPDGDDSAAGTVVAPFKTIGRAMQAASGGDVIRLRAGTYRETINFTGKGGSAGARTTIARYGDEQAIVSGFDVVTGWTQCTSADEDVVGPNYASIYKRSVAKAIFPASRVLAANIHEAGLQLATSSLKVPFPFLPDSNVYVGDWLTATEVVRDASNHILGYKLSGLAAKYTSTQIENAIVRFHGYANSDYESTIDHFDAATDTVYLTTQTRIYETNDKKDRFCLVNFLPAMRPGYWGSTEGESDFTLYVWPTDTANLADGIEVTTRPRGVDFSTASHCEIRGLIVEGNGSAADDGAGHRAIRADGPLENHSVDVVVDNCLVRKFHRAGPRDSAGVCLRNVDDSVIRQTTADNIRGTHALFFAGKSPREVGGPCYRNVIDRCLVIAGEFSPLRLYGQNGTRVTRNLAIGCGLGAHANKGNSYWGSSNNLWWGNVWHGCAGYTTWQEASGIHWGFNWIPGNITGSDLRSMQDQNTSDRLSPATIAGVDEIGYIVNNMMIPFAEGGGSSSSFNLGKSYDPNSKYAVYNNVMHGYGFGSSADNTTPFIECVAGWENNLTTNGAGYAASDGSASAEDVWVDTIHGDLSIKSTSPTKTADGHDLTDVLAALALAHPGFDGFGVDLAGNAFDAGNAPVGPYLPGSEMIDLPPQWVRTPVVAGSGAVGGVVTVEQIYVVGSPYPQVTFQWIRSNDEFLTFNEIDGATGQGYQLTAEDVGCKVGCICKAGGAAAVTVVHDAVVIDAYPIATPTHVAQVQRPRDGSAFTRLETPVFASDGTPLLVVVAIGASSLPSTLAVTIGAGGRSYGSGVTLDQVHYNTRTSAGLACFAIVDAPAGDVTVQIEADTGLASGALYVSRVAGLATATMRKSAGATSPRSFSMSATTQNSGSLVLWAVAAKAPAMDANPAIFAAAGDELLNVATGAQSFDIALALAVEPAPSAGTATADVTWGTPFSGNGLWAAIELSPALGD